ncbi:hypothetical protein BWI93_07640 [Siphonobacter sp. BAB-5385]|uniref:hypothetical protein n=1 Tax=Siphonobacter sp. BAB-5385 TaxID=1864822 RepID=UPI000B9E8AC6|nr:hypothetical protein [Siphonobacter sp. BAB-5385]OZI08717.1 hypothetical protein BWI93_07640 [Siphonobacter sp. BAB-5385]
MKYPILIVPLLVLALLSCSKDDAAVRTKSACVAVHYTMEYCPVKASLVTFLEPRTDLPLPVYASTIYTSQAAVLNLPDEFKKRDTVFYLTFHYDESRENKEKAGISNVICPAIIGPSPLIVGESASWQPCP